MRMSQAFPSKYLKSDEVADQRWLLTIRDVQMEDIGDSDNKPVVYFNELQKGMVLNKTNADMIAHLYGDETTVWTGRQIELFTAMTSFQGRAMLGLRVGAAQQPASSPAMAAHGPMHAPPPGMPNLNVQGGPPPTAPGMPDPRTVHPAPDPNASAHHPGPTEPQGGGGYNPDPLDDPIPYGPCIH